MNDIDRLALQGLGLLSTLSPVPLSRLFCQGVGLISGAVPSRPVCPSGDPTFEVLARTTRVVLDALTSFYFDVSVLGLQNVPEEGAAIIAGNHPSLVDGILLFAAMPRAVRFIVHEDLA